MIRRTNANPVTNGGVSCDYEWTNFDLGNGDDAVVLALDGVEIDRVEYTDAAYPDPTGASLSLDPNVHWTPIFSENRPTFWSLSKPSRWLPA